MAFDLSLHPERPFDLDDLDRIPDDGHRYEVLDGALVVSPPPSPIHQRIVGRLYRLLDDATPAGIEVFVAPLAWQIAPGQVPEPDLMVVGQAAVGPRAIEAAPLLVVEVLSPTGRGRDLSEKRRLYAAAGCPAYWLVDPNGPSVVALHLQANGYQQEAAVSGDEPYLARRPFPVRVVPGRLVG